MILLFVWSANGDGSALTAKASSNLLNDDTYQCVCMGICVIHPINRARCALYIYLTRKAFLEKAVVELLYKNRQEVLPRMFEKVSRLLK